MSNFVNAARAQANQTYTENGGLAYSSTNGGALLDIYAKIGGMRKRNAEDIINDWKAARRENVELADNLILYARNIREAGLGERRIGRILLRELANIDSEKVIRNLQKIVDTGRWDDLFIFIGTPVENAIWPFIEKQFRSDVAGMKKNAPISILAKWLKSENTSSQESRRIARMTIQALGLTPRAYRKSLSAMREYIDVVEKKMSAGQWDKINFEAVPSVAMSRYINTYNKRCQERFAAYKASLSKGEAKVNAATLYPYDIIRPALSSYRNQISFDAVSEAQWDALPNYIDEGDQILCICDTSDSMTCDNYRPLATSVGLGIYFAQRNKGAYHNMYMTFSSNPTIHFIQDSWSLAQCVNNVRNSDWAMSTDLDKAYAKIYQIAKQSQDAPKALIVISDMEINDWARTSTDYAGSIANKWNKEFESIGLKFPKLIYWNVESRHDNVLSTTSDNVGYVSGSSAGSFKFMQTLINKSAYEAMVEILSKPVFSWS